MNKHVVSKFKSQIVNWIIAFIVIKNRFSSNRFSFVKSFTIELVSNILVVYWPIPWHVSLNTVNINYCYWIVKIHHRYTINNIWILIIEYITNSHTEYGNGLAFNFIDIDIPNIFYITRTHARTLKLIYELAGIL